MPLEIDQTEENFISTVSESLGSDLVERTTIGGFEGVRVIEDGIDEEGEPFLWVRWMIFDREYDDVHILAASAAPGDLEALETEVDQLVQNASWIAARF